MTVTFELSLTALRVSDLERAQRFWVEGCGFPLRSSFSTQNFDAAIVGADGTAGLELVREHESTIAPGTPGGFWKIVLASDDVTAAQNRLVEHGGSVVMEAQPLEHLDGLVIGIVKDPDGYLVELVQSPS